MDSITRFIREHGLTEESLSKEFEAMKEVAEWELQAEIYWKQTSRVEWLQARDKNTAFFFNLVKARRHGNLITSIVSSQGNQVSSFQDILKEANQYFSSLFTEGSPLAEAKENLVLTCIPSVVSNEINEMLARAISLEEVEDIVFQMKKGKALGPNGFPIEFFQEFWEIVKLDLLEVVQE